MTVIDKNNANKTLAEYTTEIAKGVVVVTSEGLPVAALVPIENADLETVSMSTNPQFVSLIQRSRANVTDAGGISSEEMRRRFRGDAPETGR